MKYVHYRYLLANYPDDVWVDRVIRISESGIQSWVADFDLALDAMEYCQLMNRSLNDTHC